MDSSQTAHLKAYGLVHHVLREKKSVEWMLNYRGGSFVIKYSKDMIERLKQDNIAFLQISNIQAKNIRREVNSNSPTTASIILEKSLRLAIYTPKINLGKSDVIPNLLRYLNIPFDELDEDKVLSQDLSTYDWVVSNNEDFTGQFWKYTSNPDHKHLGYDSLFQLAKSYATELGYNKLSQLKLRVAQRLDAYCKNGGFLFAMGISTDTYDIALAAEGVDICEKKFDGDPKSNNIQEQLDFSKCFAFEDFEVVVQPKVFRFSTIDNIVQRMQQSSLKEENDHFNLTVFEASNNPIPAILSQNHTLRIKGFMGKTTAFQNSVLKPTVKVIAKNQRVGEAKFIHGQHGKGNWAFLGGYDPENYRSDIKEDASDPELHPNSPGYRLILNSLFANYH